MHENFLTPFLGKLLFNFPKKKFWGREDGAGPSHFTDLQQKYIGRSFPRSFLR